MSLFRHIAPTLLLAAVLSCACGRSDVMDRPTRKLLAELDGYVAARDVYVAHKLDQIEALRKLALSADNPLLRYEAEMNIAEESFSFSFDTTQQCLKHCQELALTELGSQDLYDRATICLGHLYVKAGSYMEAYNLLYGQLDTASLSEGRRLDYLRVLYDFSKDLAGNSGMVERLDIPDAASFRPLLLARLPENSAAWREILCDDLFEQDRVAEADSVCRLLLGETRPEEHAYAIYAYYMSDIADRMGRPSERIAWLIRSAESDILGAVKDYASLALLVQCLLPSDVDRAFRYLHIAQEDALFYNGKLRPWQISRFMLAVQKAYSERLDRQRRLTVAATILLAILAAALSVVSWFYLARSRKLAQTQARLEESGARLQAANEQLNALNQEISNADRVKERFIVSFLERFSSQIHLFRNEDNRLRNLLKRGRADLLLKDVAFSERSSKAREEFYDTFDTTFLAMYPDFVAQFNQLLQEEARIVPQKGHLNTELRIFALIRLGVDDSKQIASMLDYSLSTIYNYKVSVKNHAAVDRDSFEQRVKMIGK